MSLVTQIECQVAFIICLVLSHEWNYTLTFIKNEYNIKKNTQNSCNL